MSMKLTNLKHKAVIITAGVATLFATSCKDFLEEDLYDAYSTAGLERYDQFQSLTAPLYGGQLWSQYEQKFSWCVNEGLSGVLYNVYDQEGALFKLSIGDDNAILKEGYTSLYSGIIATANQVISKINRTLDGTEKSEGFNVPDCQLEEVKGEAMLFRAFAHFLATEYFGEVPLVLDSETDIAQSVKLPKVTRATLYKAIEKDLLYAIDVLPDTPSNAIRASKNSARAVLAKLYLTMASCQKDLQVAPYREPDVAGKYQSVVDLCTEIIDKGGYQLEEHSTMFTYNSMIGPSKETVFALYFVNGEYGEGSSYQAQMAKNTTWSPGSGWGGGKGISYNLYKSFANEDKRKSELCLYVNADPYSIGAGGNKAVYGAAYDPQADETQIEGCSGSQFLTEGAGGYVFNCIKKFVWGIDNREYHPKDGMSIQRRVDLIRLSDVYMMRAEAKMAQENLEVTAPTSSGLDDIKKVLEDHGAPVITEAIPFFEDLSTKRKKFESFTIKLDDSTTATVDVPLTETMYHNVARYDFMQERRKEFAMEGQAWLDLKRLYYRDPIMAEKFLVQMDRGIQMSAIPNASDLAEVEDGYARKAVVNALNNLLATMYPEKWSADANAKAEETILIDNFTTNNYWFLPIPVSAQSGLDGGAAKDFVNDVERGTYPY